MRSRVLVIACGAIARELVRVRELNRWQHLVFECLPPDLHNRPERLADAVRAKIESRAGQFERLFVAYADCGTGGALDRMLGDFGIQRIGGAHCYEFLSGSRAFRELAEAEPGSFYLTDFLVRHFQRLVIEGLGMDRLPQLKNAYFRNYTRLVYLAQTDSEALQARAREHADYLGLRYVYRYFGARPLSRALEPSLAP